MATRFLRLPEVERRVGLRRSSIYERVSRGSFPQPVKLGSVSVWLEGEIEQWLTARVAERDGHESAVEGAVR